MIEFTFDYNIGLNLEVNCPDSCRYNPYVGIAEINTDDPSGEDFGPETVTLIPKLDDETRSFVEAVYGSVPNLVVADNIIEHTAYSKAVCSDTIAKRDESSKFPKSIGLSIFPNPTNSAVDIEIFFPEPREAELFAVDVLGRKVWQQPQKEYPQGTKYIRWEINNLPSGVYYIIIHSGEQKTEGKIYLIK